MVIGAASWYILLIVLGTVNLMYGSYKFGKGEATLMHWIHIGVGVGALARVIWQIIAE